MALSAFLLQAGVGMRASVPALVASSGLFAKFILLLLLGISVYTWAIIVERLRLYVRVQRDDRAFLAAFRAAPGSDPPVGLHPSSLLAKLARTGERVPASQAQAAGPPAASRDELAQRARERAAGDELVRLERHVGFLATAGSVSPFIGLMGTVWGVMSAFLSIGAQGSASLVVVAPGIAEALIRIVDPQAGNLEVAAVVENAVFSLRYLYPKKLPFLTYQQPAIEKLLRRLMKPGAGDSKEALQETLIILSRRPIENLARWIKWYNETYPSAKLEQK